MYAGSLLATKKPRFLPPLIIALCISTLASGSDTSDSADVANTSGNVARSTLARDTSNITVDADVLTAAADNNRFAERLLVRLQHNNSNGDNLAFSPYSLTQALAMTAAGARGNTLSGIESAMSFSLPSERRDAALNKLDLLLKQSTNDGSADGEGDQPSLVVVNQAWAQRDYPFRGTYLDNLALHYGVGIKLQDFKANPEPPRLAINKAVSDATRTRIKDLLSQGALNQQTRLVLTNAVWFKARWQSVFKSSATKNNPFIGLDGVPEYVPFMNRDGGMAYAITERYQAVELPYRGDKLSMLLVMPKADFDSFVADGNYLTEVTGALHNGFVALSVPKFKFDANAEVEPTLKEFGMSDAFSKDTADFSDMYYATATDERLFINNIAHKAFIAVDENGTEATAATAAVVFAFTSIIVPPPYDAVLNFDRPFLFVIRENDTGAVLFLGAVLKP